MSSDHVTVAQIITTDLNVTLVFGKDIKFTQPNENQKGLYGIETNALNAKAKDSHGCGKNDSFRDLSALERGRSRLETQICAKILIKSTNSSNFQHFSKASEFL